MRSISAVLALVGAIAAGPVLAQSDSYDVEVVVFEHLDPAGGDGERWRPNVVVPPISDATAFDANGPRAEHLRELPEGFEQLGPEESELGGAVKRLNDSDRYRVLRHSIWRQPALSREEAVALRFEAGEPTTVQIPASAYPAGPIEADADTAGDASGSSVESTRNGGGDAISRTRPPSGADGQTYMLDSPFGLGMLTPPLRDAEVLPLDGTVKLVVSRYLHLHATLYYTSRVEWVDGEPSGRTNAGQAAAAGTAAPPRITRGPDGQAMLSYGLQQERRMRSGELHYMDHPVIGVLVKVTPYEGEDATAGS